MNRKRADPKKYFLVFLITTIIFISGLSIGSYFSFDKLASISNLQDGLRTDTMDLELQYDLVAEDPCQYANNSALSNELYDIAKKLDYMESQLGKKDQRVLRLKRYYSILQIRQWLFEKRLIKECGLDRHLLLFFYSNNEGECESCEDQGFILSYLRKKHSDSIMVFSFDTNLESYSLKSLKERFRIKEVPSIVIDDRLYEGFMTTPELETIITTKNRTEESSNTTCQDCNPQTTT